MFWLLFWGAAGYFTWQAVASFRDYRFRQWLYSDEPDNPSTCCFVERDDTGRCTDCLELG